MIIYVLKEVKEFETFSSEFDYDMVTVKKEEKIYSSFNSYTET